MSATTTDYLAYELQDFSYYPVSYCVIEPTPMTPVDENRTFHGERFWIEPSSVTPYAEVCARLKRKVSNRPRKKSKKNA